MSDHPNLDLIARIAQAAGIAAADPVTQPLVTARAHALEYQKIWNQPLPAIGGTEEITIPGPRNGTLRLRLHYPDQSRQDLPVVAYFHGGGFVLNNIDVYERLMRLLALRTGAVVVGIAYSLAPEVKFPGQLDQALAAIAWLRQHGQQYGLNSDRLVVAGDSAGANLALSTTLALRDQGLPLPVGGISFYGMFGADLDTASHHAFGSAEYGLTSERMDWFWTQYLADRALRDNPAAVPLLADLSNLPPQLVIAAGLDCLRDDSIALAEELKAAGTPVTLSVYDEVPHSFIQMSAHLPEADAAISEAALAARTFLAEAKKQAAA